MTVHRLRIFAGILGFTGVALGAFGAHGLKAILEAGTQIENWKTAVFYQLVHAMGLLVLTGRSAPIVNRIGGCWIAGTVCFSGSLYWIALGGPTKLLWPVTPLGGLLFLAGWGQLVWSGLRQRD